MADELLRSAPPAKQRHASDEGAPRQEAGILPPRAPARGLLPPISLLDLALVLRRRLLSASLIFLSVVLAASIWVLLIRGQVYVAEAKLLVRLGQEQAPVPTMIADRQMMVGSGQPGFVTSELELLRSRDTILAVVDRIDLTPTPPDPPTSLFGHIRAFARDSWKTLREWMDEAAILIGLRTRMTDREIMIEQVSRSLVVEVPLTSMVVSARVLWPQRGVPQLLLEQILDQYFESRSRIMQGSTAVAFFQERRTLLAEQLSDAEAALAQFGQTSGLSDPEEQRTGILRRLNEVESALAGARIDHELAESLVRQALAARDGGEESLTSLPMSTSGNPTMQALASELATLSARNAGALTALSQGDQAMRRQRAEIAALSASLVRQAEAMLQQRRQILALRQAERARLLAEVGHLQELFRRWQELRREVAGATRAFEQNEGRLVEAQGIAALEQARIGSVLIVQRPSESAQPIGLRRTNLLALAVAIGAMLALLWVAVREFFDQRLHQAQDIETRLGLRLIAEVPYAAPRRAS
jgi:polysaccharide biosynthesis protein PslE